MAATISVLGNQFRVEVTLHKWQMLETAFALRPVLVRALDAPTSRASLCSWSIHHRHDAGDAAQSDLRDFCNRPQRVISHRVAAAILTYFRKKLPTQYLRSRLPLIQRFAQLTGAQIKLLLCRVQLARTQVELFS